MSAFLEGDRVIITSEDGFDGEEGVIIEVDQPSADDYIGTVEEWEIDFATTFKVRIGDGTSQWFEASELAHI